MIFRLSIDTRGAAFEDTSRELARILHEAAIKVLRGRTEGALFDLNGNRVGDFYLPEGGLG